MSNRDYVEVNHGLVRCILEGVGEPPYGMLGCEFVDITDLEEKPQVGWMYDAGQKKFEPNPYGGDPYHPKMVEEAWRLVRNSRLLMLHSSDYTQLPDYPDWPTKRRYRRWRKDLRDLPSFFSDPYKVQYPAEPTDFKLTFMEKLWYVWNRLK